MQLVRFDPGAIVPTHRHHGESLVFGIEGDLTDEHGSTLPGFFSRQPDRYVHSMRSANGATMLCYTWGPTELV